MDAEIWGTVLDTEWPPLRISWALIAFGGLLGLRIRLARFRLGRPGYLAAFTLLVLGFVLSLRFVPEFYGAFIAGHLWLAFLLWAISVIVIGALLGVVARARARDGFGQWWPAVFAFIPVLGVILVLWPPAMSDERTWRRRWVGGIAGLLTGACAITLAAFAWREIDTTFREAGAAASRDPAFRAVEVRAAVQRLGLVPVIRRIANDAGLRPVRVGPYLVLDRVRADRQTLRLEYEVTVPAGAYLNRDTTRHGLLAGVCADPVQRTLVDLGATIEISLAVTNSLDSLLVIVAGDDCAATGTPDQLSGSS